MGNKQLATIGSGRSIKATPKGELTGYLVLFTDQNSPDLTGDFFTAETDFDMPDGAKDTPIYYDHGMDPLFKRAKVGRGKLTLMAEGVWLDGQLDMNNPKTSALLDAELGLSSGTASHLVEREQMERDNSYEPAWWIKSWPLGLDASLTTHPAEPRTIATVTIKSLDEDEGDEAPQTPDEVVNDEGLKAEAEPETAPSAVAEAADNPNVDELPAEQRKSAPEIDEQEDNPDEEDEIVDFEQLQGAIKSAIDAANAPLLAKIADMETKMAAAPAAPSPTVVPGEFKAKTDPDMAKKAFEAYFRYGVKSEHLRPMYESAAVKAALNQTTDGQGGYLVPPVVSSEVITALNEGSIFRQAGVRQIPINGTDAYKQNVLTNSSAAAAVAEGVAYDQSEPTFAQASFAPWKYTKLVKASEEVVANANVPIETIISEDAANAFTLTENEQFTLGDGTTEPQGLVVGSSKGADAAAGTITYDDLTELYYSLGQQYRRGAVWMMNDGTLELVRKIKDSAGNPIWGPMADGQPETLFGRPVFENVFMADVGASAKSVVIFHPRYFQIVDFNAGNFAMRRLDERFADVGQIGYRWHKYMDSKVLLSAAVKHLLHAAS